MSIVHETKDWTWVLERPCPECGFDTRQVLAASLPERTRAVAEAWQRVLTTAPASVLTVRPRPERWSALEYGCHVRDVCRRMDERLALMLAEENPTFAFWDQDATAEKDRYGEQDPAAVARELVIAADAIATRLAGVTRDAWPRTGLRSDGSAFTVEGLGRYFIHDPVHHLVDVGACSPGIL